MEYLRSQANRFPDLDLDGPVTEGLSPRDAALAHTICDVVARRWLTLRALLQSFLKHPFDEAPTPTRAALLAGAAQVLLLDRIPDHAAISESVEYTKVRAPKTAGLVNAVLRGVTRALLPETAAGAWALDQRNAIPLHDGSRVLFARPLLSEDATTRLADATGCPAGVVAGWATQFGEAAARDLALHTLVHPPIILNTAHATSPLPAGCVPHEKRGCHVYAGDGAGLRSLLTATSSVWVQDAASTSAVALAKASTPSLADGSAIVDLCAGQGTKTRQLAATFPLQRIIATDTDARRLSVLRETFTGHARVRVVAANALEAEVAGNASLVLLDVPCSNSGVLPRRPEARYRLGSAQMARLVQTQREILTRGAAFLAPGGTLVYSTCSIDHEENEEQAAWAASLGLVKHAEERTMPQGVPGGPPSAYHDGAYAAVLRRE